MELQMQVAQAVQVLNHDALSCNRVAANQWLVQFQRSDAAWDVAASILTSDPLPSFDLHLFAAQILKRKIQNEGAALQAEQRSALQGALLVSAKKFSAGPPQLLTQICLALSALVLRAVELKKPVEQLFSSLSEIQGNGAGSYAILELLTVLPEEVIEDNVANATVQSERRSHFTHELLSHTGVVLEFLLQQFKDDSGLLSERLERHKKVLRSLLSWVRVGCFLEIPEGSISTHPLLGFVYDSLQVPALFDVAIEVLVEFVIRYEALPQALLMKMQSFKDALLLPALANKDERTISGLTSLFAEIGQAAIVLVAEGGCEAFILTDALLRCVAYRDHDWEIADSTLNFWCSLAEFILGLSNKEQKEKTMMAFAPVYSILLDALFLRAKVVDYSTGELEQSGNIPDGLVRFRRNLEELLTDICYFLGPTAFLAKVLNGSWVTLEQNISWEMVEVRLFTLNTVAEVVLECEQQFDLSVVTRLILAMNTTQIDTAPTLLHLVRKSAAEVIGSFSKLLCQNSTAVLPLLSFLASGIQISIASSSSAVALRKLCEEVPLISEDDTNLEGLIWIGEGLHNMGLPLHEEEDIVSAVGHVLVAINNLEVLSLALKRVLKPSYEVIDALVKTDYTGSLRHHSAVYAAALEASVRALNRLGVIFRHLSVSAKKKCGEEPVLDILRCFWPLLQCLLASSHMESSSLAAAACRSLSFIIQLSGQQFLTLLSEVMVTLCQNFSSVHSNECFIRTAVVALEEFGHKEELGSLFVRTFSAFTEAGVISAMNSPYACDQEPDVVEAYMSFASTFLRCCSKIIIVAAGSLLETSFKKATIWCTAMHRGAALAAMSYISRFLEAGASCLVNSATDINAHSLAELCLRICSECGESMICGVFYALLGVSAMTRVHKAATILQQLAAVCYLSESTAWKPKLGWGTLQIWLANVVHALPAEYLRCGEAEQLISSWLKAMEVASTDYYTSTMDTQGMTVSGGHMQGHGGRSLKRLVREFADVHRHTAPSFGSI